MKVTVSCAGRFHAYNLAAQLHRHQALDQLITTYPKSEVKKYGIPSEKTISLVWWEILNRAFLKGSQKIKLDLAAFSPKLLRLFETASASRIPQGTDVYIGWSSTSEAGLKVAKKMGAITILERGSSHIQTQTEVLLEEYERVQSVKIKTITHQDVIEKELKEYELADYISVPSSYVKRTFLERGIPEHKLIQNAYGVGLNQFAPGEKLDKVFRIIFVGQMSFRKGVHYLLEAFASLRLPNAELVLVGGMTEEMKPYLNKYGAQVKYLGTKPQYELIQYYQQASVFAICSIEEGMAMVQAQAMACALPLLCTTNTGGEDLICDGKEGFVIPIRNVNAIKEKIEWLYLHQEECKNMGLLARERVVKGFTWEDYGDRYVSFLNTLNIAR